uniref:Uncharacterized protein n=1 Tax=Arundo donax TaxID=35708 RepID=A0A0A9DSJ1_ARUDO
MLTLRPVPAKGELLSCYFFLSPTMSLLRFGSPFLFLFRFIFSFPKFLKYCIMPYLAFLDSFMAFPGSLVLLICGLKKF